MFCQTLKETKSGYRYLHNKQTGESDTMSSKARTSVKEKAGAGLTAPVRSLDRQITAQDLDCLREAFALFDADRQEEITTPELGKVRDSSNQKPLH